MAGRPIWYGLMTPDPAAVAPFYRAVIGWEIPAQGTGMSNGADYRLIARPDGGNAGGVLTLTPMMAEHGVTPAWLPYFHVEDVAAALGTATGMGAQVIMEPSTLPAGTMAMLADPQGAVFYLMNPKPPADQPDAISDVFKAGAIGHCAWNELSTDEAEAQIAFYTDLLGWTVDGEMPMPGDHIYKFIACEGEQIGAIGSMKPLGQASAWLPYFRVAEIAAAANAVTDNGGVVWNGPHEVPGNDHIIMCQDPAGANVAFVGAKGA